MIEPYTIFRASEADAWRSWIERASARTQGVEVIPVAPAARRHGPYCASYDLKKFRGQQIVQRVGKSRRHQANPAALRP
jgi:hypothetical protein